MFIHAWKGAKSNIPSQIVKLPKQRMEIGQMSFIYLKGSQSRKNSNQTLIL